jgi:hypothetical protein
MNKIVWYEKKHDAEFRVKKLLQYKGALADEDAGSLREIIGSMGSMPDLSALYHIHNIVVMAPHTCKFGFQTAGQNGNERLSATQLPE